MRRGLMSALWLYAVLVTIGGMGCLWAQEGNASTAVSVGQQAVNVVLKRFAVNPIAIDSKSLQTLRGGSWSISKTRPTSCPQTSEKCVEVFYQVPAQSVKCSWVILLNADGTDGTVLAENDEPDGLLVRKLTESEAKAFVNSRKAPIFPNRAISDHESGTVVVDVLVGKTGNVEHVALVSGPPVLQTASIDAARKWSFKPMTVDARAMQYEVQLVFTFRAPLALQPGIPSSRSSLESPFGMPVPRSSGPPNPTVEMAP